MTEVPTEFAREQGCTVTDWCRCLPGAVGAHTLVPAGPGAAEVDLQDGGRLHLQWQELPPRRIALLSLPRLAVRYRFEDVSAAQRADFLRRFDLYMQRGGG